MAKHSLERIKERYNLELSTIDEQNIIQLLKSGNGIPLPYDGKEANQKFAYVVYKHIPIKVLYQRSNKGIRDIITAYPINVEEYNELVQKEFESKIDRSIKFLKANGYIVYRRKK